MSCKFALLLLFGFVALAVAVPLEDTEQKAEPAEPAAADDEKLEALEESEADEKPEDEDTKETESESEEENVEDTDEEPQEDDNEENEIEPEEEDDLEGIDKRGRNISRIRTCTRVQVARSCKRIRRSCYRKRPFIRGCSVQCCLVGKYVCRRKHVRVCRRCRRCSSRSGYRVYSRLVCRLKKRVKVCSKHKCFYRRVHSCRCYCRYTRRG